MISCRLMGGLGNYMFQIGAAVTLAKEVNTDLVVDVTDVMQVHKHYNLYRTNLFRKLDFGTPVIQYRYEETEFSYRELPKKDNLKLFGHFQSEKYLNRDLVLDLFNIDDIVPDNTPFLQEILHSDSVSIHVRRGDYTNLQEHHPLCTVEYYTNSINLLGLDKKYFVFSDDVEWCKTVFDEDYITVSGLQDWEELYLMSKCKHNIIANSTFSWWGAWLNTNSDKTVVAPKNWFGPAKQLDTKDLLPNGWTQI